MDETATLAFIGHARPEMIDRAFAFEDEALTLLKEVGGSVLFRGRRVDDTNSSLPAEVHILTFPTRQMLTTYLQDNRRLHLLEKHGEVLRNQDRGRA